MNITQIASTLDWRGNNHGVWKALVKDMTPDSTVTFANGYTATVSGRTVSVTNTTAPVGAMTYDSELTNAVTAGALYGAGSVSDSLEAVGGDKTVRMGSVDLGSLTWGIISGDEYLWGALPPSNCKIVASNTIAPNFVHETYTVVALRDSQFTSGVNVISMQTNGALRCRNGSTTVPPSGILYYELAEPTTSTETPQFLSLTTGDDTLSGGSFDTAYEGTDYSIPLIRNCKYIYRDGEGNETLLTGSTTNTSKAVVGGRDKLINLTHWFGKTHEPSIEDFYKIYPTWKTYDIPYDQGSVLNYKGTGVETIGFNAYNHATGTAALLGGNKYQICGTFTSVSYVDIFGNTETITLDSANCFTPVNDGVLTVTGGNGTDTLVHLVWSGYKNYGEPEYKWEPFTRNSKELPISTYFPEGMNGIGSVSDELTSEQFIQRFGLVALKNLAWTYVSPTSSTPGYFVSDNVNAIKYVANGSVGNIACGAYNCNFSASTITTTKTGYDKCLGIWSMSIRIVDDRYTTVDAFLMNEGDEILIYELATPVVTQIDQPLNLAYPVNDFGTEHSLPQNTTTLVTTDLKALIKYNTDFMRMNSQLAPIFPTVKSLVQQEQDGYIMKKDDTAPNAIVGGAYNLIDRNAEGTERQFSYDTAGGSQDITDGTAVAKKSMGTTLNLNQLVHDTNQNVVTGNGQVEVEDAVAGDVTSLVVEGRSLVRNQLVPPSLEETEDSANGVIEVTDAVAGDAKRLVMTAPRSVVVNQLVDVENRTGWILHGCTISVSGTEVTCTNASSPYGYHGVIIPIPNANTHLFALRVGLGIGTVANVYVNMLTETFVGAGWYLTSTNDTSVTWVEKSTVIVTARSTAKYLAVFCNSSEEVGATFAFKDLQFVDLTQYFNGDSALIDSITSWDDLVAYDPRFASYVEYNTGEVEGVQPTTQVTGKNLLDDTIKGTPNQTYTLIGSTTLDGGILLPPGTYYWKVYYDGGNTPSGVVQYVSVDGVATYSSHTFTLTKYSRVHCRVYPAVSSDSERAKYTAQIELGNQATAYEPYHAGGTVQAPTPLFGIGTAADSYDAVTGKVGHQVGYTRMYNRSSGTDYFAPSEQYPYGYAIMGFNSRAAGPNLLSTKYPRVDGFTTNKTIHAGGSGTNIYVVDDTLVGKTSSEIREILADVMLYYELATPTEETLASSTISLQAGTNVALQTDGGRTTLFSLTYDGTEFTLPLDSTHKYAFSNNGTKSIVTGATEQAVTGGQDMLVDVTRMFNGDTTAINAVTSWADMAAVMPEYLSNVAYNEGEVVGRSGGVTTAKWNQLVQNGNFADGKTGWQSTNCTWSTDASGATITVTSKSGGIIRYITTVIGHVYFARMSAIQASANHGWRITFAGSTYTTETTSKQYVSSIRTATGTSTLLKIADDRDSGYDAITVCFVQVFDLTEIYGAGHEPSTVEDFEADCAKGGKDLSQYQPYDAGTPMGGSATFSDLHGVGDVKETLDVVTGEKQVNYGEVDLGTLSWTYANSRFLYNMGEVAGSKCICDAYIYTSASVNVMPDKTIQIVRGYQTAGQWTIIVHDSAYTSASAFKSAMSGVMLYYELATPTTSSLTPQPLTFAAGLNNVHEENMDITGTPVTMEYTGTDYVIATKSARVYLKDVDGTVERVTGVTSIPVRGGRDNIMDLTRMFGAGLEPGTLADFYSLFPTWNGYRLPYNKGSLLNFKGTGLKSVGFNLVDFGGRTLGTLSNTSSGNTTVRGVFDETKYYVGLSYSNYYNAGAVSSYNVSQATVSVTNNGNWYGVNFPVRCIPGMTYRWEFSSTISGSNRVGISFYTYNGTWISGEDYGTQSVEAPANAYWVMFSLAHYGGSGTSVFTDPCLHLQWSGTRNGDYEQYWDYVRPIPTLTYFPDGMNGRGSVYDEINPRQAVRRFGKVDLGTLTWSHSSGTGYGYWSTTVSGIKRVASAYDVANIVADNYTPVSSAQISGTADYVGCIAGSAADDRLFVNTGSTTVSPTGWLIYELATPVVTTFQEEISATARISDYGTEECLPVNGYDPVTAPFRGMVLYQDDYARTITKLPENYQSQDSMDNLLALLGPLVGGTITATFDSANQVYTYQFTPNA